MSNNLVKPPVRVRATPNITPFTYYDGATYLEILERLRVWLTDDLHPAFADLTEFVTDEIADAIHGIEVTIDEKLDEVDQALADQLSTVGGMVTDLTDYVNQAVDQIINSTIEITRPVINGVIQETAGIVNAANYEGDSVAQIRAAIDDANTGDTVRIVGSHTIDETIVVPPEKRLTLDFTGANILSTVSGGAAMVYSEGAFSPSSVVTGISNVTVTIGDQEKTVTALQLTESVEWSAGDIVRVVSDDTIPGGHYTSDTLRPRMGDYARVLYANGSQLILSGALFESESYTQNIRVARLEDAGTWTIKGGEFSHPESWIGTSTTGNFFRATALVNPRFESVTIKRAQGMCFSVKACFGYLVSNANVDYAEDAASRTVLGYGVHDSSCTGGQVVGGSWRSLRHMYSDGTNFSPALDSAGGPTLADDNVIDHGRTLFASVRGFTAYDCSSPAVDTHHMAYAVSVSDATIYAGPGTHGVQFRGYGHSVKDVTVHGGVYGLHAFTQGTQSGGVLWARGDTSGIVVDGFTTVGTTYCIVSNLYSHATHPNNGQRDKGKTIIARNISAIGASRLFTLTNSDVTSSNSYVQLGKSKGGSVIAPVNSTLYVDALEYDASLVEEITGTTYMINVDSATAAESTVSMRGMRVRASTVYREGAPVFVNAIRGGTRYTEFLDIVFEEVWDSPPQFLFASNGARLYSWRYQPTSGSQGSRNSSAEFVATADDVVNTNIIRRLTTANDDGLTLIVNLPTAGDVTMAVLPAGMRAGTTLTVMLGSATGNLIVRSGSEYNTAMLNGDTTLSSAGQMVHLVWIANRWRQVA